MNNITKWNDFFEAEKTQDYYVKLMNNVENAYQTETVFPPREELFSCFDLCPYEDVKVVIIGQDPYHRVGQAHGLSFSVKPGEKVPPSLKNIYKELKTDLDIDAPNNGYLVSWAEQGVLMLNTSLTVTEGKAGSHKKFGWAKFTSHVLEVLNDYDKPIVFILWGNHAIDAAKGINNPKHLVLKGTHPSPLAGGGFFGCKHFSKTNEFLVKNNRKAIDWAIPNIEENELKKETKARELVKHTSTKPKYKKLWETVKEVDFNNDVALRKYSGIPVQVINLNGKQTLIAKNGNKIEFLDPITFKKVDKSITLAPSNQHLYVSNYELKKVNNEWCFIYQIKEYRVKEEYKMSYMLHIYNIETKENHVLVEESDRISKSGFFELENELYMFVAVEQESKSIIKFNLNTLKEVQRFDIPETDLVDLFCFINDGVPTLLVKFETYEYPASNYTYFRLYHIISCELLGKELSVSRYSDFTLIKASDNNYMFAILTKENHLYLHDTKSGEQKYDILVNEDYKFMGKLVAYNSKLFIASWMGTKIYDVLDMEIPPKTLIVDGDLLKTSKLKLAKFAGKDVLVATNCFIRKENIKAIETSFMISLDSYEKIENVNIFGNDEYTTAEYDLEEFINFKDDNNRELYISKYREKSDYFYTVLWNPLGQFRPSVNYTMTVTTIFNGNEILIAYASNQTLHMFDCATGNKIVESTLTNVNEFSDMKVANINNKQQLLIQADNKLYSYDLTNLDFSKVIIEDMLGCTNFDLYDSKVVAGIDEEVYIWDIDNDEPVRADIEIENIEEEDEVIGAISKVSVVKLFNQEYLFVSNYESSTYLYDVNKNVLQEFDIDNKMWNIEEDDPDYCIYEALVLKIKEEEVIVTISHHGAVTVFDAKTLKRKSKIVRAYKDDFETNCLHSLIINEHPYIVTYGKHDVRVWNLLAMKKEKEFKFKEEVTAISTINNKIIVCYGENIRAIEVSQPNL